MPEIKIVISIPIHEAVDVAINQAENIKKYVKNAIIIFHVSIEMANDPLLDTLANMNDVCINPIHLKTGWGKIVETHISNFKYADNHWNFEYFVMHSSNDMYVTTGLYEYISGYEAGFNMRTIDEKASLWVIAHAACSDDLLNRIRKDNKAYASQIEGSFYSRELMRDIVKQLEAEMPYDEPLLPYPREELFFSTVASTLVSSQMIGKPTTFSEVHRFDRIYQNYYKKSNCFFAKSCSSNLKLAIDNLIRRALFRSRIYAIRKKDIKKIRARDAEYISKNGQIDDGQGLFHLYDKGNVFSVKRVPRTMSNPLRKYINRLDSKEIDHEN